MTMHLVGPYMTTTNYKKRKSKKPTDNQLERIRVEWRQYNKRMRQQHCHSLQFDTLEEYIAYTQGKHVPKVQKSAEFRDYKPQESVNYQRSADKIPSLGNGIGNATKSESVKYTGDLIVGIATMHKSNAVPVMRGTKQAEEIAKMRR